jgi:hypothetical protein
MPNPEEPQPANPQVAAQLQEGRRARLAAERKVRWLMAALGAVVLITVCLAIGGWLWIERDRQARQEEAERVVNQALEEATALLGQAQLQEALSAVKRAETLLRNDDNQKLREREHNLRKDLEMLLRLEEVRLQLPAIEKDHRGFARIDAEYEAVFRNHGLDLSKLQPEKAGQRISKTSTRAQLVAALNDWAAVRARRGGSRWKLLLQIAQRADPNTIRHRVREAWLHKDLEVLHQLASRAPTHQAAGSVVLLASALAACGEARWAIELLRVAMKRDPADFRINQQLANLTFLYDKDLTEVLRQARAAVQGVDHQD